MTVPEVPEVPAAPAAPDVPPLPAFRTGAATHVGMIRTMNEDAFIVGNNIFAVADGMGGHLAGEVASAMAIEALGSLDGSVTVDSLVAAVIQANTSILQMSRTDASRRGMGTTLTAIALVHGDRGHDELAVINLGDSRTYRFHDGMLEQVSVDHSYVQELVAGGHLTVSEARYHPQRNIVTRALGIEPEVGIDVWNVPMERGDRFLLCSDGLVDEVEDADIADVLADVADPQTAAERLVELANTSGGRDNVTVLVIDILEGAGAAPGSELPTAPVPLIGDDMLAVPRDPEPVVEPITEPVAALAALAPVADEPGELAVDEAAPAVPVPAVAPMPTVTAKPKRRRTNLKLVGLFGGIAVVLGVILVANRDDSSPTPTSVPTTTSTTAAPPSTPPSATITSTTKP